MFTVTTLLANFKNLAIMAAVVVAIWFYKDYEYQIKENSRLEQNADFLRKKDSTKYAEQLLDKQELNDYLKYENASLAKKLANDGIRAKQIESITHNNYYYKDTIARSHDVSTLLGAIRSGVPGEQEFTDTTRCLDTKASIIFDGRNKLSVKIKENEFKNTSDAVVYWKRRQWKFLFIKSTLFGKKEFTSKNYNDCGESVIMRVEKQK